MDWVYGLLFGLVAAILSFIFGLELDDEFIVKLKNLKNDLPDRPIQSRHKLKETIGSYENKLAFAERPRSKQKKFKKPNKTVEIDFEPTVYQKYYKPNSKINKLNNFGNAQFGGYGQMNKVEGICKYCLDAYFGVSFNKIRPKWLLNKTGYPLELDCFNGDIQLYRKTPNRGVTIWKGLALEYQGPTHYQWKNYINQTKEEFLAARERDKLKKKICNDKKVVLVEIPYTVKNADIAMYLYNMLDDFGYKSVLEDR